MHKYKYTQHKSKGFLYHGIQIHRGLKMPKSVRLTEKEQALLYRHMIKINKSLSDRALRPIQETDIIHYLLEEHTENVKADENGKLYLEV